MMDQATPSKMNPVSIYIFDVLRSIQVELQVHKFYFMCSTSGEDCSKAETLFTAINDAFKSDDLDWDNIVSVGLDNTNTNMGSRNSLRARILAENRQTFIAGCNCHLQTWQQERVVRLTLSLQSLIVRIPKLIYIIFPKGVLAGMVLFKNILTFLVVSGKALQDSFQLGSYP